MGKNKVKAISLSVPHRDQFTYLHQNLSLSCRDSLLEALPSRWPKEYDVVLGNPPWAGSRNAACKLQTLCVKILEFDSGVLGNLVPFVEKFVSAIYRRHTECSGGNLRLSIGSAVINVNSLRVSHY